MEYNEYCMRQMPRQFGAGELIAFTSDSFLIKVKPRWLSPTPRRAPMPATSLVWAGLRSAGTLPPP